LNPAPEAGPFSHEVHIAASTERTACAGDDHDAHGRIAACFFESFGQITTHVTDERVEALRPVQSDRDDAGVFGNFYELFGHEKISFEFRVSSSEFRVKDCDRGKEELETRNSELKTIFL
jgi:hypothetical protein